MMFCAYCGTEQPIRSYWRDCPMLDCGHGVFPEGSDEKKVQDLNEEIENEVALKMNIEGISAEEAESQLLREELATVEPKQKLALLRTLHEANIIPPEVQEAEDKLSRSSRRFVTGI